MMTDIQNQHVCNHEREFAVLEEMRKSITRIEAAIIGNGKPGLKTQVELDRQAILELKTDMHEIKEAVRADGKSDIRTQSELNKAAIVRLWWAVGWIALSMGGTALYIIRSGLVK